VEDLDEVASIEAVSSLTPWSKQMFREEMAQTTAHCYVMILEDVPTGPVIGFLCFRNFGEESDLLNICVHPDHRHHGFGRQWMQFYTAFCRREGITTFHLEVNDANRPAVELYRSFSYHSVGVRPRFYRGEFDALRMMKRI